MTVRLRCLMTLLALLTGACAVPLPAPPPIDCAAFVQAYERGAAGAADTGVSDGQILDMIEKESSQIGPDHQGSLFALQRLAENLALAGRTDDAVQVLLPVTDPRWREGELALIEAGPEAIRDARKKTAAAYPGPSFCQNQWQGFCGDGPRSDVGDCGAKTRMVRDQAEAGDPWAAMATFDSMADHDCHAGPEYMFSVGKTPLTYVFSPTPFIGEAAMKAGDPALACRALNAGEPYNKDHDLHNLSMAAGERGNRAFALWLIERMKQPMWRRSGLVELLDSSLQP